MNINFGFVMTCESKTAKSFYEKTQNEKITFSFTKTIDL